MPEFSPPPKQNSSFLKEGSEAKSPENNPIQQPQPQPQLQPQPEPEPLTQEAIEKRDKRRGHIVNEIMSTEIAYLSTLTNITEVRILLFLTIFLHRIITRL